jgi:hypothetical protein
MDSLLLSFSIRSQNLAVVKPSVARIIFSSSSGNNNSSLSLLPLVDNDDPVFFMFVLMLIVEVTGEGTDGETSGIGLLFDERLRMDI